MYGWAWVLKLAEELHRSTSAEAKRWEQHLQPLTAALVKRHLEFLPKQTYPIRTGVHPNTAFALGFALDYATAVGDATLKDLVVARSRDYFLGDAEYPAKLEPNGSDFLSPALVLHFAYATGTFDPLLFALVAVAVLEVRRPVTMAVLCVLAVLVHEQFVLLVPLVLVLHPDRLQGKIQPR